MVDINSIARRLTKIETIVKGLQGFQQNESEGIERETRDAAFNHIMEAERFRGLKMYLPHGFPKVLHNPFKAEPLTDLDGVVVLTNDPDVADFQTALFETKDTSNARRLARQRTKEVATLKKSLNAQTTYRRIRPVSYRNALQSKPNDTGKRTILVIVEAKHHVTSDDVEQKLKQMHAIRDYILQARHPSQNVTSAFLKNAKQFKFEEFDPDVYLFIGGPLWSDGAVAAVKRAVQSDPKLADRVGAITANGSRYSVAHANTLFRNKVPTAQHGAGPRVSPPPRSKVMWSMFLAPYV